MAGIARAVLVTIIVSICLLLFINLALFFPWYITLITETFHLSQVVASDNYLKESYYDDALDRLQERPIFRDKRHAIKISVKNADQYDAIGYNDETFYIDRAKFEKPYRQRGEPINVEISAVYPLTITLWGEKYEQEIPISFSMTTTGLKHYKDLEFYYAD